MDRYVASGIRVGDRIYDDAIAEGYDVTSVRKSKGAVHVIGVIPWVHRPHEKVRTSYRESAMVSGYQALRRNPRRSKAGRATAGGTARDRELILLLATTSGRDNLRFEKAGPNHYRLVRWSRAGGGTATPITGWHTAGVLSRMIRKHGAP